MVRPLFSRLFKSRSAVSAVISNLILIAAVIAVGFTALGWTYSTSNSYVTQYGSSVRSSSEQLAESLAFEYVYYNGTSLSVYIVNCGKINAVNLTAAYVANAMWTNSTFTIALKWLNGTSISSNHLDMGQEGYFVWSGVNLQLQSSYTIKIITWRGSSFEYQLAT
jgi:hypothetical protein